MIGFGNHLKTVFLLATLGGLLIAIGGVAGGSNGALYALIFAILANAFAYFYSDKIVLAMYGAKELDHAQYKQVYDMVADLAADARIPMPKVWLINEPNANAFATGRNPEHASIAYTTGIMGLLDADELRAVTAHELSHVKNRDILIGTIAATIAAAVSYTADMLRWSMWFGGNDRNRRTNPLALIAIIIIAPFVALLIQLAISRSREFLADESGAHLCHMPLALASALEKISGSPRMANSESYARASTAHLFIANPFKNTGSKIMSWFSTHPPVEERVKRLRNMI